MSLEKQITIIIGLPGSGKSFLINNEFNDPSYTIVDDPMKPDDIPSTFEKHLVIADCRLCRPKILESFYSMVEKKFGDVKVNKIYFENNPQQCLKNVEYRNDGRLVEPTIRHMTSVYNIPEGERIIPVFDTSKLNKKMKPKL